MEYSLRSNCLVALYEGGNIYQDLAAYSTALTVLDLAAGGRMLCRLHDSMCALQPSAFCTLRVHSVSHTMRCAGKTTPLRHLHCWTEAQATRW